MSIFVYINNNLNKGLAWAKELVIKEVGVDKISENRIFQENNVGLSKSTFKEICDTISSGDRLVITNIACLSQDDEEQFYYLKEFLSRKVLIQAIKENRILEEEKDLAHIKYSWELTKEINRNSLKKKRPGRPKGSLSKVTKLTPHKSDIIKFRKKDIGYSAIGRILETSRHTVKSFCESEHID